jgi:hypothetical protein
MNDDNNSVIDDQTAAAWRRREQMRPSAARDTPRQALVQSQRRTAVL